jgi:hypothetical protein
MIRESIRYSIHFQKNGNINLQPQIKIRQMVPLMIAQTKNKNFGYSQVYRSKVSLFIWGILVHKLKII